MANGPKSGGVAGDRDGHHGPNHAEDAPHDCRPEAHAGRRDAAAAVAAHNEVLPPLDLPFPIHTREFVLVVDFGQMVLQVLAQCLIGVGFVSLVQCAAFACLNSASPSERAATAEILQLL